MKPLKKGASCIVAFSLLMAATAAADVEIVVGDKLFNDFSIHHEVTAEGSLPAGIDLNVIGHDFGGNSHGLLFDTYYYAHFNETITSWINYTVSVLPESDQLITASSFDITDHYVGALSTVDVQTRIFDAPGGNLLAELNTSDRVTFDSAALDWNTKQVYVENKLMFDGNIGGAGLHQFYQAYDQIPEPASMGMLGAGSIFALILRNRKRRNKQLINSSNEFEAIQFAGSDFDEGLNHAYVYTGRSSRKPSIF